jgi:hypothetical protein
MNACALVRYVTYATRKYAGLTGEEKQCVPIDPRPSDRAAFHAALLKDFLNHRHRFSSFCVVVFDETFVDPPLSIMTAPYPAVFP